MRVVIRTKRIPKNISWLNLLKFPPLQFISKLLHSNTVNGMCPQEITENPVKALTLLLNTSFSGFF